METEPRPPAAFRRAIHRLSPTFLMRLLMIGSFALRLDSLNRGWCAGIAPDERHEGITARTVLSHTTGLPNWRWDNDDGELDLKFAPGERFSYSGEGFEMLADVLAHRLGTDHQGLDSVFRAEVAALGMRLASISPDPELARRTASRHVDGEPGGNEWCCNGRDFMASGGLHTEALSYASFLLAFLRGEGITEEHWDEMLSPQVVLPPGASSREQDRVDAWGLGFASVPRSTVPCSSTGAPTRASGPPSSSIPRA
jgi:CubicO group peptidase (beta-lactamase class C family)